VGGQRLASAGQPGTKRSAPWAGGGCMSVYEAFRQNFAEAAAFSDGLSKTTGAGISADTCAAGQLGGKI